MEAGLDPDELDVIASDRLPMGARHPEAQRFPCAVALELERTAIGLIAETASHPQRTSVVGKRGRRRLSSAKPGETQMQRRRTHLLADTTSLELLSQPRACLERPQRRKVLATQPRRSDQTPIEYDCEVDRPSV